MMSPKARLGILFHVLLCTEGRGPSCHNVLSVLRGCFLSTNRLELFGELLESPGPGFQELRCSPQNWGPRWKKGPELPFALNDRHELGLSGCNITEIRGGTAAIPPRVPGESGRKTSSFCTKQSPALLSGPRFLTSLSRPWLTRSLWPKGLGRAGLW